jgi:tetratricopeptide (TPR) repeat protein
MFSLPPGLKTANVKPNKDNGRENHPPKRPAPKPESPPSISKARQWIFRLGAMLFIPLLMFGGLEVALRLARYGYPTSFFVRSSATNYNYFVTNEKFGYRFFPPALARTPVPLRMAAEKSSNSFRIFLFGESAAQGDPDPTFGMGRYLQVLLHERYPDTDFDVVCVAMTAINSHTILPIARECAGHDGDLWIIYMGNNEMVGPFGAGTVFGPQAPNRWLVKASLAAKATKTGQLVEALMGHFAGGASAPKAWGGLNMFQKNRLRYDDPARLRAYWNFAGNLNDIVRAGRSAGVPIILSTVASNLKDCAPFASLHPAAFDERQQAAWDQAYQAGVAAENAGSWPEALDSYSKAAAVDPQFAELHYRMGRCQLALSNSVQARKDFELARDYDCLAFRADTRINEITREAAARNSDHQVSLLDAVELVATNSPSGIAGDEYLYEHVHLNFDGNYLLGHALAEKVAQFLPASIKTRDKGAWASAHDCDNRLAVSLRDRYRVFQANFSRFSEPPFTDQLNDVPRARSYMAKLQQIQSQMSPDDQTQSKAMYDAAVAASPDDPQLLGNYAQFLGEIGDWTNAIKQQTAVCKLLPDFPAPWCKAGVLLVRQGKDSLAVEQFSRALALRRDYVPALNELGLIFANQQKVAEAGACFTNALRENPGYVETYLNLGFMEQSDGRLDAALARYHEAANLQSNGPAAYFSQAVTLAAGHRRADAIDLFHAAVYMNPSFWQARYLLGVELNADEKTPEAQEQFANVVRFRPDFARAHLNLGVTLAKQGKIDDALGEFQTTLGLNPTNKSAQQNIELIQKLKQRTH